MEAIKAIAKRTKTGKYKFSLPSYITATKLEVIVVFIQPKKNNKI